MAKDKIQGPKISRPHNSTKKQGSEISEPYTNTHSTQLHNRIKFLNPTYRIDGKFGRELNLAVWLYDCQIESANIKFLYLHEHILW